MVDFGKISTLLDEFKTNFPDIDFSSIPADWNGYGKLEHVLSEHVKEFTKEQWKVIFDYKYADLFQDGTPHYSWNTDRSGIASAAINEFLGDNPVPTKVWDATWDSKKVYYIDANGTFLEVTISTPHPFCNGRTSYSTRIVDEMPDVPTHVAVRLAMYKRDGKVYVADQFIGTNKTCNEWIAQMSKEKGGTFNLIRIK